jgi:hypothetical protein
MRRVGFLIVASALAASALFSALLLADDQAPTSKIDTPLPWGATKDGLRTRLVAAQRTFAAGKSIPMQLQIENRGDEPKEFYIQPIPNNESLLTVVDERRKPVPYLGRLFQFLERPISLRPGEARTLAEFDLASCYYLRRPGRYTARFPGDQPSAAFEFDVLPNEALAATDGDPVGRLLPLVKEKWWLGAGEPQTELQPGANWDKVPGRIIWFVFNPPQHKDDSGMIWICLADRAAPALPPQSYESSSQPSSQYWNKLARWHVYVNASQIALNAWPTARQDITKALATEPERSRDRN